MSMRSVLTGALLAAALGRIAAAGELSLTSRAFADGATIPRAHTCDGADASPPLAWRAVPAGTKAFVLVVDDPDAPAGTWVHWVLYDLPATATALPAGVPLGESATVGGRQGKNDFRRVGYGGPCPPPGPPHHYHFTLYALDAPTGLAAGATKADVLKAIAGHTLGTTKLVGTYGR
jgi:Raf kinase inhibitor-like YbhB/YbcL family protein